MVEHQYCLNNNNLKNHAGCLYFFMVVTTVGLSPMIPNDDHHVCVFKIEDKERI